MRIKKQKVQKCVIKEKRRYEYEDYKNCLEAIQIEIEIINPPKIKPDVNSLRENQT